MNTEQLVRKARAKTDSSKHRSTGRDRKTSRDKRTGRDRSIGEDKSIGKNRHTGGNNFKINFLRSKAKRIYKVAGKLISIIKPIQPRVSLTKEDPK